MTAANAQHAQDCEQEHESEGLLMEELGRLLGEVKASSRYGCDFMLCTHALWITETSLWWSVRLHVIHRQHARPCRLTADVADVMSLCKSMASHFCLQARR